eukprot:CAMPEP_0179838530 /NCGR_PEP_ID=MMETSP0982-20121206/739_1 /TAXON_ID=483367 /ORGANISM="non described non described, Strain CCMP 2436" /LENGTH=144 /DNA_ID=CAMNT_0021721935 /DNA_START=30 /DNA_END=460 /DNA_ORIENTATION=-
MSTALPVSAASPRLPRALTLRSAASCCAPIAGTRTWAPGATSAACRSRPGSELLRRTSSGTLRASAAPRAGSSWTVSIASTTATPSASAATTPSMRRAALAAARSATTMPSSQRVQAGTRAASFAPPAQCSSSASQPITAQPVA